MNQSTKEPSGTNFDPIHQPGVAFENPIDKSSYMYQNLIDRNYTSKPLEWISEAWKYYKLNPLFHLKWFSLAFALTLIPIAGFVMSIIFVYGIYIYVLRKIVEDHLKDYPSPKMGWEGFRFFYEFLGLFILQFLLVLAGMVVFILPGIYLFVATSFSCLIYIEYKEFGLTQWEAIKASIILISKQIIPNFCFFILLYLIYLAGLLCLLIGIFVAYPVICLAIMCAFRDIVGFKEDMENMNLVFE